MAVAAVASWGALVVAWALAGWQWWDVLFIAAGVVFLYGATP